MTGGPTPVLRRAVRARRELDLVAQMLSTKDRRQWELADVARRATDELIDALNRVGVD